MNFGKKCQCIILAWLTDYNIPNLIASLISGGFEVECSEGLLCDPTVFQQGTDQAEPRPIWLQPR